MQLMYKILLNKVRYKRRNKICIKKMTIKKSLDQGSKQRYKLPVDSECEKVEVMNNRVDGMIFKREYED